MLYTLFFFFFFFWLNTMLYTLKGAFVILNENQYGNNDFYNWNKICGNKIVNLLIKLVVRCKIIIKFKIYLKKYIAHTIMYHQKILEQIGIKDLQHAKEKNKSCYSNKKNKINARKRFRKLGVWIVAKKLYPNP